uniref:Down Syndrome Cell Adhesion Molecules n=1 Tax=Chelicerata TaxID=6843 RepID=UPI0024B877F8|nr:Chain A, Down Syndrome Cell Adhesion Molecules [Chelicerata]
GSGELNVSPFVFRENVMVGEKVTATCTTVTEDAQISFKWFKNGKQINDNEHIKVLYYTDFSLLSINPVKADDSGNYTCVITAKEKSSKFTATLTVKASPEWLIQPENVESVMGSNISLQCSVTGIPTPTINWKKSETSSGTDFKSLSTSSNAIILPGGTLNLLRIIKSDEGLYECQASNGIGNDLRKTVTISVFIP